MAKANKLQRGIDSKCSRATRYLLASGTWKARKHVHPKKKCHEASGKKDWEDATCSVCMEFPHNAVLLLCSSYNKGCRPYMCATSNRYSNCLEQYKKAYTKVASAQSSEQLGGSIINVGSSSEGGQPNEKSEVPELLCPLCRGQVKGWTVVEPARKYLNAKKRTCMQDKCTFVGNYKELRKHVKAHHPLARPRAVDPVLEEKWKRLECERERSDVISTIISSTPGAVVLGDYVLEPNQSNFYSDYDSELDDYLEDFNLGSFNLGQNAGIFARGRYGRDYGSIGDDDDFAAHRPTYSGYAAAASGRGFHRTRILVRRRRQRRRGRNNNH
ncbi:Zinc finger, RING/FYVE/PHD-type [Trema orientale]|uniref:Zinc finger, RING/FYVE/PHD-type n=1 Tax=Trema orientale TaxID=63057 RepID=A0A2P5D3B4_TREOI|nr:Zinc finger, RING/FYVE/PHD-type [Trema orientale]